MRLLNTRTFEFKDFYERVPKYAILSHRWENEKITCRIVEERQQENVPGWAKVRDCCMLARTRHVQWIWVDTCCIDKTSSSELSEAINSMYRWYAEAKECYVYMSDVGVPNLSTHKKLEQFASSVWFTRGWTLQELVAPKTVLFWNRKWEYLGSKEALNTCLEDITGIDSDVLSGEVKPSQYSISQRMSWAARRSTTRAEDRAYCLIGLFNVSMGMRYGEGEKAFRRLQEEIMKSSDDHSIFAWRSQNFVKPALAPAPVCFTGLEDMIQRKGSNDTIQGFTLSNAGLSIQLYLIPWAMRIYLAPLRCGFPKASSQSTTSAVRDYSQACLFLQQTSHDNQFVRVAVDGEDLKVMDEDQVKQIRDEFKILPKMILLEQPNDISILKAEEPAFYGFQFVFKHRSAFQTGYVPSPADALCYHTWTPEEPVFEVETGGLHAAGLFRLSGYNNGLYVYFGFDYDFAPLCLISSRTPRPGKEKKSSMLPPDLSSISKTEAVQLLNLNWLRSQVAARRMSEDTVLTFKGHRFNRCVVECRSLAMSLTFERKKSKGLKIEAWHVTIDRLRQQSKIKWSEDNAIGEQEVDPKNPYRSSTRRDSRSGRQLALLGPPPWVQY